MLHKAGITAILFTSLYPIPAQCLAYIYVSEKREGGRNKTAPCLRNKGILTVKRGSICYIQVLGSGLDSKIS